MGHNFTKTMRRLVMGLFHFFVLVRSACLQAARSVCINMFTQHVSWPYQGMNMGSGPTLTRWHAQTCNDLQRTWEAEFEKARDSVRGQLGEGVNVDVARLEQDIRKSDNGVVSVTRR